jgi:hypothetical protein
LAVPFMAYPPLQHSNFLTIPLGNSKPIGATIIRDV